MPTPLRTSIFARTGAALALLFALSGPATAAEAPKSNAPAEKTDARYSAAGLRQAFKALCQMLGYRALVVEIDESEFPYLVYGVLEGRGDYRAIRDALPSLPDYVYAGSVTAIRDQRDGTTTAFALNLTPPNRGGESNPSRIMARMKRLTAPPSR